MWLQYSPDQVHTTFRHFDTNSVDVWAGKKYGFRCTSNGSHPSIIFSWSLISRGNRVIGETIDFSSQDLEVEQDSNGKWSMVYYIKPKVEDHNAFLVCKVLNPRLDSFQMTDELKLNVLRKYENELLSVEA